MNVVEEVNAFLEEMMEAQLDEETINDEIAIESIEVPEADVHVDKEDGNELDEDLEYSVMIVKNQCDVISNNIGHLLSHHLFAL